MSYAYGVAVALLMLGLYTMIVHRNLFKKFVGMTIFQTAVILFFLLTSIKRGGSIPIVPHGTAAVATGYMNPLPHALMLTAIVVGVATAGLAFAIMIRLHAVYGSLEEDVIAAAAPGEPPPGA